MIGANVFRRILIEEYLMKEFFKMDKAKNAGGDLGESEEMNTKKTVDVFNCNICRL